MARKTVPAALLVLACLALPGPARPADRLLLESGPGRAGPLAWESVRLAYFPARGESAGPAGWRLSAGGLELAGWQGALEIDCSRGGVRAMRPGCAEGRFEWRDAAGEVLLSGRLAEPAEGWGLAFELEDQALSGTVRWPEEAADGTLQASLRLSRFELAGLPDRLVEAAGLSVLEGRVDGRIDWAGDALDVDLAVVDAAFDRPDGLVAGAGLALSIEARLSGMDGEGALDFSGRLSQGDGELLAGPVYLPPPERPLSVELSGALEPGRHLVVDSLAIDDGGMLEADASLRLERAAPGWQLAMLSLDHARLEFPGAWRRWGDGPAAARGLGDLETTGSVQASGTWRGGALESLDLRLDEVGVRDPAGRFSVGSIDGFLRRGAERLRADLTWERLALFSLEFGASELALEGLPGDWHLRSPLRLPLLDGAVVFDSLSVAADESGTPAVALDARIDPLDLARLTEMLGWPSFGGQLSGRFPGVRLRGDRITFSGGIDVQAFSGAIRLSDLVIERPFGSLPALAAQVEIDRLDLAQLTGAFNFGHMEGRLSGWMRDLRLLDWQPVAMDARLFTHDDAPSRRISQRAVENLSRLGGGAAALGATVLRMFEEFPYRRAGLACRLDRNICHIDGVAPHESGGFYIVQGRGLPHLDVVGHRRLVDWPRLVAQLVAMTEG
jgi:hypothetical protein